VSVLSPTNLVSLIGITLPPFRSNCRRYQLDGLFDSIHQINWTANKLIYFIANSVVLSKRGRQIRRGPRCFWTPWKMTSCLKFYSCRREHTLPISYGTTRNSWLKRLAAFQKHLKQLHLNGEHLRNCSEIKAFLSLTAHSTSKYRKVWEYTESRRWKEFCGDSKELDSIDLAGYGTSFCSSYIATFEVVG
jgi:hypothetical protein